MVDPQGNSDAGASRHRRRSHLLLRRLRLPGVALVVPPHSGDPRGHERLDGDLFSIRRSVALAWRFRGLAVSAPREQLADSLPRAGAAIQSGRLRADVPCRPPGGRRRGRRRAGPLLRVLEREGRGGSLSPAPLRALLSRRLHRRLVVARRCQRARVPSLQAAVRRRRGQRVGLPGGASLRQPLALRLPRQQSGQSGCRSGRLQHRRVAARTSTDTPTRSSQRYVFDERVLQWGPHVGRDVGPHWRRRHRSSARHMRPLYRSPVLAQVLAMTSLEIQAPP
mmetsp:Transcript_2078/g.6069  ORF Transcript_2078/g.6069 Transcript_2078/m.6069 type:complete len:280 (+) Transcript_2078:70-909(+)